MRSQVDPVSMSPYVISALARKHKRVEAPITELSGAFNSWRGVAGAAFIVNTLVEFEDKYAELGEQIERTSRSAAFPPAGSGIHRLAVPLVRSARPTRPRCPDQYCRNCIAPSGLVAYGWSCTEPHPRELHSFSR
jgi:hypothetical protein